MADFQELFYLDKTGLHTPDLAEVYDWLVSEYQDIYGKDVILTSDTQDGQFLGIIAQAIHDTIDIAGLVYNSFSPSTALADALDKNVRINGIARKAPTYSMCDVIITGAAGTTINQGSVKDDFNRVWNLPSSVVIPIEGQITVTAQATEPGEWVALPHTLTVINTPTRGWQSVTNDYEATAGAPVESDADLRRRQGNSVAMPSQSVLAGMIGAVASIAGVTRYRAYENDTSFEDANGIPPHSTCMVIEGGNVTEIAAAIHRHKTLGSGTHGDTTVVVEDRFGLTTHIAFQRPQYYRIKVQITIKPLEGYTNVYAGQIKERLLAYINSLGIGDGVFVARLIPPVLACNSENTSTFDIVEILVAKDDDELTGANINIPFDGAVLTEDALITVIELTRGRS